MGKKLVDAGALGMVRAALQRDAAEGKTIRGEMLDALDAGTIDASDVELNTSVAGKHYAGLFMSELLDSVETLTGIAEEHGARTLADLMFLQNAILNGGFIDHYPGESNVLNIASSLPTGARWAKFIKVEHMLAPVSTLSPANHALEISTTKPPSLRDAAEDALDQFEQMERMFRDDADFMSALGKLRVVLGR